MCGNTFFASWRPVSYWNSIKLITENSKWDAPLFEYELGWTAFLASRTPQSGFQGGKDWKRTFKVSQLTFSKTSQIWRHLLLATPVLLDWSMMRNIHSFQIFTVWSYKPAEHFPLGSLLSCCPKKKTKNMGPHFLNSPCK